MCSGWMGGGPDRLLKDLEWLGLLFESLVIRDLRVLAQALEGEVFHYRDNCGVEVDAIVQLRDGRWGRWGREALGRASWSSLVWLILVRPWCPVPVQVRVEW